MAEKYTVHITKQSTRNVCMHVFDWPLQTAKSWKYIIVWNIIVCCSIQIFQYQPNIGQCNIKTMCQVKWQIVWCFHCSALLSHSSLPPVLAFCLFFDFANFSSFSLLYPLSHSLSVKLVFSLLMFSLCSQYGLNPHHSLRFSVVPPGGCSFVPPSSSPFWSGTATAFLLSLSLLRCMPTFPGFQRQTVLLFSIKYYSLIICSEVILHELYKLPCGKKHLCEPPVNPIGNCVIFWELHLLPGKNNCRTINKPVAKSCHCWHLHFIKKHYQFS